MRRIGVLLTFVVVIAFGYGLGQHRLSSKDDPGKSHPLYYIDPMHPAYRSDKPGIAPDCGMPLQPVFSEESSNGSGKLNTSRGAAGTADSNSGTVSIDPPMQEAVGIRLATVRKDSSTRNIRAIGRVVPEDTQVYRINSGVDGFVRETYGDSVGQLVSKDQKLAVYYAPEFIAASSGFLAANERIPGSVTNEGARSLQNYMDRLRNLGMSDQQIKHLAQAKQLPDSIEIVSPVNGVILARNISAGQHFERGMDFYKIANLNRVWVVADIYPQDQPYVRSGALAQITLHNEGRHLVGRVSDSLPQADGTGSSNKIRLEVSNPKLTLRPDMLVDVELSVHLPPTMTVPLDALIDAGSHARVFVERSVGVFEPREVQTGWRTAEDVQIVQGLKPGERIVVAAAFLVDSESRLRAGLRSGLSEASLPSGKSAGTLPENSTRLQ